MVLNYFHIYMLLTRALYAMCGRGALPPCPAGFHFG